MHADEGGGPSLENGNGGNTCAEYVVLACYNASASDSYGILDYSANTPHVRDYGGDGIREYEFTMAESHRV